MKISARNVLQGKVKSITRGAVEAEVSVEIGPGTEVVSIIDLGAVDDLELEEGKEVYAVFEATDVMIGISHHKR